MMISPSDLDKEDEDFDPLDEDDDDDYRPGKKKRPKRKKKPPPKIQQKTSSQFQFVAEIPIEFDVELPSKNEDSTEETKTPSEITSNDKIENEQSSSEQPPKKKPRKMITPQRSRTDPIKKNFMIASSANNASSNNNGSSNKDPLALTDSANNIPKSGVTNAVNRFPCGFCDTVFTDISFLDRHHKRCKTKRTQESISLAQQGPINITKPLPIYTPTASGRFMYACDKCPFSTKNPEHLKYHRPIHNDETYFSCDACIFTCRDALQLETHKLIHSANNAQDHATPLKAVNEIKQETNKAIDSAVMNSDNGKPLPLPASNNLPNEKQEDSGVVYNCDQCTYVTSRHSYLVMHKKIHVRDQPYQCVDCGYKCSRLAYFKKHRATHGVTDDTLISCDRCSFTTSSQNVLDAHKQCHKV